jgi:hypothetical protein
VNWQGRHGTSERSFPPVHLSGHSYGVVLRRYIHLELQGREFPTGTAASTLPATTSQSTFQHHRLRRLVMVIATSFRPTDKVFADVLWCPR